MQIYQKNPRNFTRLTSFTRFTFFFIFSLSFFILENTLMQELVYAENAVAPAAIPADTMVPSTPAAADGGGSQSGGQPTQTAAPTQGPGGMLGMVLPFALMFGVLYLFVIRPQNKKMKEHQGMIGSLQHGDGVVTQSGILGKVTGITDKVVTLEIAQNVKVKMLKDQVSKVVKGDLKDLV